MSKANVIETGPWAGWRTWAHDVFETATGPFHARNRPDGSVETAFVAEPRHMNGGGSMHGGCLLTFADFSVFAIADEVIGGNAVTVNRSGDFLGPASVGERMVGTGEVTRAGGRLIYVRGLITAADRPCLSFSSVITRIRK
jgi:acyl-coenzyme A thioesterase PaaI-like protein